jgi:hypothetical protein
MWWMHPRPKGPFVFAADDQETGDDDQHLANA